MKDLIQIITLILLGYLLYKQVQTKEGFQTTTTSSVIPSGVIVAWSGAISDLPSGWILCNGSNGTPNLQGRFILGYNPTAYTDSNNQPLTSRTVGTIGGKEQHTLAIAEMPWHKHNSAPRVNKTCNCGGGDCECGIAPWQKYDWGNDMIAMEAAGGSKPHENMPPFYVLAYIMKV